MSDTAEYEIDTAAYILDKLDRNSIKSHTDLNAKNKRQFFDTVAGQCLDTRRQTKDTKGMLQELTQGRYKTIPEYVLVSEEGPSHNKLFVYEVKIDGNSIGKGQGKNKKSAQQAAATDAIENYFNLNIYD